MNAKTGFRFQMGCGEPLHTRRQVALRACGQSAENPGGKIQPMQGQTAPGARQEKSKS